MEYKGYSARVVFDEEAGVLFGEVEGLRDVVTFEATDVREVETAFRESIDDYLAMCAERKEDPEKPYSGKFLVRVDPLIHRKIAMAAAQAGLSMNAFTTDVLQQWINREASLAPAPSTRVVPDSSLARGVSQGNAIPYYDRKETFLTDVQPGGFADAAQKAPVFGSPSLSKHTPGNITPAGEIRTPPSAQASPVSRKRSRAA